MRYGSLRRIGLILTDDAEGLSATIVALAKSEFAAANATMKKSPRRVVRAPRIMGEAYWLILQLLVARGFAPPRAAIRLPRAKLLFIVLRNLV